MDEYLLPSLLVAAGLGLLVAGGELLVRGAARLAAAARISSLVIGLTVVAFGTSAPEFAVTIQSSLAGRTELALGNVVGSNIFNVLVVLGLSALVAPLVVSRQLIRWDVPLMIAASLLAWLMCINGRVGRVDGAVLFACLLAYLVWSVVAGRRETERTEAAAREASGLGDVEGPAPGGTFRTAAVNLVLIVAGLALLTLGSRWLVDGSAEVARMLGVSEFVIGVTIIAVGTSLPELVTSVVASLRNERDIAVGNIVGSNMFNILGVLGVGGLVAPAGVVVPEAVFWFDLPVMVAVAGACLPIFFTGHRIDRWEGGLFFAYYVAYVAYLISRRTHPDLHEALTYVMAVYVIPITVVTVAVCVVRAWRRQ